MTRTLTTSKGEQIVTHLTDREAIAVLSRNGSKLSPFAFGLLNQSVSQRGLTQNQIPWLHKIALQYEKPATPAAVVPAQVRIDLSRIRALLEKAAAKLKYPRIRFELEQGKIQISIAGERSRTPGAINITDGGPFGSNVYYGKILTDGTWQPTAAGRASWVLAALQGLAADPAGYARVYGTRYGTCCFCGRHLEDGRSVAMGYGPVCADNFGLEWGERT